MTTRPLLAFAFAVSAAASTVVVRALDRLWRHATTKAH
jgi:hypothetical protein